MDVIWFKRDVRLHDHAPLYSVISDRESTNPVCLLYLYEPNQLIDPTVHGSHIALINEGLVDLDQQFSSISSVSLETAQAADKGQNGLATCTVEVGNGTTCTCTTQSKAAANHVLRYLTVCYGNAVPVLREIHAKHTIRRLLAHEETGHYASYQRDRHVRKWCKEQSIPFREYPQSGVTRRLANRDDFSNKLKAFLEQPQHPSDDVNSLKKHLIPRIRQLEIVADASLSAINSSPTDQTNIASSDTLDTSRSSIQTTKAAFLTELEEIPLEHRVDRPSRQRGGERAALLTLQSFLEQRGEGYSAGISSPLSSWTSCSRLSVFLSWGHMSLRRAYQATKERQEQLKRDNNTGTTGTWRKSLAAFQSRLHWRSHFIQKLESDPLIEKRDLHPSYQPLRRQPGDWNEAYYQAWATGKTGYPFVDACMQCLLQTGWLNFRMRAMLVSFATYNLWLDWKRIAPHLARLFADYEPGIHYPQLQMQAGTTGINAMRIYNVVKQGKDHDADGTFVKRYIPALRGVPKEYIHEPWKCPIAFQAKYNIRIKKMDNDNDEKDSANDRKDIFIYPARIVDADATARVSKAKIHDVRKLESSKELAKQVYEKHGSRSASRDSTVKVQRSNKAKPLPAGQPGIQSYLSKPQTTRKRQQEGGTDKNGETTAPISSTLVGSKRKKTSIQTTISLNNKKHHIDSMAPSSGNQHPKSDTWACRACTFENDKPLGLMCSVCGTTRTNK